MRTFGLPNVKQLNMVGRPDVFLKKVKVFLEISLRNFAKFTGKHLCQSLFFNKVAGRPKQPWEHNAEETIEIECILL